MKVRARVRDGVKERLRLRPRPRLRLRLRVRLMLRVRLGVLGLVVCRAWLELGLANAKP